MSGVEFAKLAAFGIVAVGRGFPLDGKGKEKGKKGKNARRFLSVQDSWPPSPLGRQLLSCLIGAGREEISVTCCHHGRLSLESRPANHADACLANDKAKQRSRADNDHFS